MQSKTLDQLNSNIRCAEQAAMRDAGSVTLLAVSKNRSAEKIRDLYHAGQTRFGENYLQEALEKMHALKDLPIEWHFIGNIQSNKTKLIAEHFSWVQSVSRLSIAKRLNNQRPLHLPPLNICIEVNIDHEKTKSGVPVPEVFALATKITKLNHITLRGLMIIPEKNHADAFQKTFLLQQELNTRGFKLDTLSMGMSSDFEEAIRYGSTMVRIGTALFEE